ncbi:MAG: aminopeptidase [Spirochaetia bacterium]|nr:aminopeptidase [Spirochaetia bacterium]
MRKKYKITIVFNFLFIGFLALYMPWIQYVLHLAAHQGQSIFFRENISKVSAHTQEEKNKLLLIQNAKEFGKKLYQLKESKSFEYYVNLDRKALGWNLTISPELEMKAKEFDFPIVGKFGYLGFFNETIKNNWKNKFVKQGYDVYENEIGAYSTLGYFKDPIFSTYLEFDENQLIRLILHEMVHEKFYLKNDSDFSESMAVFMEKIALNLYLYKQVNPPNELIEKYKVFLNQYNAFEDLLEETKTHLDTLYKSNLTDSEKRIQKREEINNLRNRLKNKRFYEFTYASEVSEMPELNNAFLVQNSRYTPKQKNGFSVLLKDCNEDILCWFDGIKKLEPCKKEIRKKFLAEEIILDSILLECKNEKILKSS